MYALSKMLLHYLIQDPDIIYLSPQDWVDYFLCEYSL